MDHRSVQFINSNSTTKGATKLPMASNANGTNPDVISTINDHEIITHELIKLRDLAAAGSDVQLQDNHHELNIEFNSSSRSPHVILDHRHRQSPPPTLLDSSEYSSSSPGARSSNGGRSPGDTSSGDEAAQQLQFHAASVDSFIALLGSDPIKEEIDRLETEIREKNKELAEAHAEIKALKLSDRSKQKALEELTEEVSRLDERLERAEILINNKNLELKRANDEKKEAQAAQLAAEATLRRMQGMMQKDDDMPPLEAILAPLDAEIKLTRQEVARLQEDNRALERLTKAKETALLEAEARVEMAMAKASMVEDLQNRNQELIKHIEYCQEENKLLEKLHKQKVQEIEKLNFVVVDLEDAFLNHTNGAENAAKDYQRQLQLLQEEKKTLERELARVKITANRVAVVVANSWKDNNDKVMPVKQWIDERRCLQAEMTQLREKLATMEKAYKTEALLKEKVQLRLKVLEDKIFSSGSAALGAWHTNRSTVVGRSAGHLLLTNIGPSSGNTGGNLRVNSFNYGSIASADQDSRRLLVVGRPSSARALLEAASSTMNGGTSRTKNNNADQQSLSKSSAFGSEDGQRQRTQRLWRKSGSSTEFADPGLLVEDVTEEEHASANSNSSEGQQQQMTASDPMGIDNNNSTADDQMRPKEGVIPTDGAGSTGDYVSGQLYDLLQKEVLQLRKTCQEKDRGLSDKDSAIEMLEKKVCTLSRTMEIEAKRVKKEVASMERELTALRSAVAATSASASAATKSNDTSNPTTSNNNNNNNNNVDQQANGEASAVVIVNSSKHQVGPVNSKNCANNTSHRSTSSSRSAIIA